MTTKPPAAKEETPEQIAESIARRGLPFSAFTNSVEYKSALNFITKEVLSALRNERERAAGINEAMRPSGGRMWTDQQTACFEALTAAAAAIRGRTE